MTTFFLLSECLSMNITDVKLDKMSLWSGGINERIKPFINSQESP